MFSMDCVHRGDKSFCLCWIILSGPAASLASIHPATPRWIETRHHPSVVAQHYRDATEHFVKATRDAEEQQRRLPVRLAV